MTIEKGRPWGDCGPLPDDGLVVDTDAAAGSAVDEARRQGRPLPVIGLIGGDLCRTLGGRGNRDHLVAPTATRVVVDVGRADFGGQQRWFVAHCIARRRLWAGRSVSVMNAAFLDNWNLAPRAHPNDGRFDVIEADLAWADRLQARSRLPAGTHVPHPDISQTRISTGEWSFDRPLTLHIDGRVHARVRTLTVTIEPDALRLVL